MTESAILRFNRDLLFELETDGTPEGSIVKAPFSGTIPGGGPVLSFDSSVEILIPLIVDINPVQEGSGDPSPSNVRPISGWDSVDINVTGINIWDEEWEVGGLNTTTGVTTPQTDRIRSKNYIPIIGGKEYYFFNGSNNLVALLYDYNKNYTGKYYYLNANQPLLDGTDTEGCGYIKFYMVSAYGTTYKNDISINYPATDTSYHIGANNESYPISLGQTVYGGILDVVSGKLTVNKIGYIWDGSSDENWNVSSGRAFIGISNPSPPGSYSWDFISNYLKPTGTPSSNPSAWQANINNTGNLLIGIPTTIADASAWRTYLSNNNLQFVYTTTPTEIQLTPTEVKTLIGSNNIWSNTGDVYTSISTENVTYKITGGAKDVQRFNKIWESLLLYRNGGLTDEYRNLSGEGDKIIPHDPAILKEE